MKKNIKGFIWILINKNNAQYLNKIRKELNRIWKESNNFIETHIPNNDRADVTRVNLINKAYLESLIKINNPHLSLQIAPNLAIINFYEMHSGDLKSFFKEPIRSRDDKKSYKDLIEFNELDYSFIVKFNETEL